MRSSRKEALRRPCSSSVGDPLRPVTSMITTMQTSRSGMPEKSEALPAPPPGGGILGRMWWSWLTRGRQEQSSSQDLRVASRSWCSTSPKACPSKRSRGQLRANRQAPYSPILRTAQGSGSAGEASQASAHARYRLGDPHLWVRWRKACRSEPARATRCAFLRERKRVGGELRRCMLRRPVGLVDIWHFSKRFKVR